MNFKFEHFADASRHFFHEDSIQKTVKKHPREFFGWLYKVIASVPLDEPSCARWLEKAPVLLRNIVYGVFCDVNRSQLVTGQVHNTEFSAAIPPLLYSYKLAGKNWKYSEWDNDQIKFGVGKYFWNFLDNKAAYEADGGKPMWGFGNYHYGNILDMFDRDTLQATVTKFVTKQRGKPSLKNWDMLKVLEGASEEDLEVWNNIPQDYRRMICQTWIFHPDVRREGMILDLFDWDNIPEPLWEPGELPGRVKFGSWA